MKLYLKRMLSLLMLVTIILNGKTVCFAATTAGQEMRTQVLYLADIITSDNFMNDFITRGEFARMVVKASSFKDSVNASDVSTAFLDVESVNEYAPYIKIATKENYMTSYLGGYFKPNDYVTMKDLVRACLALLGYENTDFKGSQVQGRYELFCSLRMNENVDKLVNDFVTKKDCVNAIYNTLKTKKKDSNTAYGTTVFKDLSVNSDGDLNATGLTKTKLEGPFILKRGEALNLAIPFDITTANIFINGTSQSLEQTMRELNNSGYLVYYYNKTTKTIYVYKEGTTLESSTLVKKGYVNHIYYSASDTITPTRVEIDLSYYTLSSSEVKFAFSYSGTIHVGDQIIFIYTKANDSVASDEDTSSDGEVETIGTITHAYLYNLKY
ncbi:MAG: S-layer homology domain-containing protein [Lachnospiraceae bacterium]|nr:S-layer homology domain-containing protein [Lachnospiraceae bacterium]